MQKLTHLDIESAKKFMQINSFKVDIQAISHDIIWRKLQCIITDKRILPPELIKETKIQKFVVSLVLNRVVVLMLVQNE